MSTVCTRPYFLQNNNFELKKQGTIFPCFILPKILPTSRDPYSFLLLSLLPLPRFSHHQSTKVWFAFEPFISFPPTQLLFKLS